MIEDHIEIQMEERKKESIEDVLNGNCMKAYREDPYVNYFVKTIIAARENRYPMEFFMNLVEFAEIGFADKVRIES